MMNSWESKDELPSVLEDTLEVRTVLGSCKYESTRKLTEILVSKECTALDCRAAANIILILASRLDSYRRVEHAKQRG